MAAIKSYSDLEQSKKLAEILPIESADQTLARIAIAGANLDAPEELQYRHNGDMPFRFYSGIGIPCWSLAALFNILPSATLDTSDDHYCRFSCQQRYTEWHDNPIDACYEMIIKLNELKML